ncbi:MAG: winged helix-turn-helix domain-containing tetratricopeptide repeat protein [Steroidobacteraceae bacterium]
MLFLFEDYALDSDRRELRLGTSLIAVEPQVFDLLEYLIRNRDRVVSRDDLIESIWRGRIVSESNVNTRINAARYAIGDSGKEQRLIRTLPRKGIRFVGAVKEEQKSAISAAAIDPPKPALALPDRPSLAVLPFANMSGDTEQEYFSDGITEDIITALSKWRWFFVIARNSSFSYKGRQVDVKQVARELGVHYVLEGSVRKADNRVRVTAQLIDAVTGAHMWAERYDRDLTDVFAIQDELTQQVASAIEPALSKIETEHARRKTSEQMAAWDHYLRGMWYFHQFSQESSDKAIASFNCAIELDDTFADAYVGIARTLFSQRVYRLFSKLDSNTEMAAASARKALTLDPDNASACYILAITLAHSEDANTALGFAQRGIELNSNFAPGYFALAMANLYLGLPEEALVAVDQALRLSPSDPQSFVWRALGASALYLLGRYAEAAEAARQSLGQRWFHTACRVLAASYAQLGMIEPAKASVHALLASDHADKTIAEVIHPFERRADRDRYAEGLRKAGMPER